MMVQPRDEDSPHWKYLQPADLRRLRNFQFAARLVVEGFFQGQHRSPYYDFSEVLPNVKTEFGPL